MDLDEQICEQARLNRDARFDGRVFIGVTSTGVYCRPVCPSPHAKRVHVRYFPSAAAAAHAGFRPCLRCRPEVAPGTPAWNGTSTTVTRGLRLIAEGALDEAGVETLAARLGVSSRHLSRLFLRHLGALPTAVAQTRRLHFSKQLISDTNLSMTEVAIASGFRSIRRFNDVFRQFYGRPPSELRRLGTRGAIKDGEYVFHLAYRPPYDWESLLSVLAARAAPGVESVGNDFYRRTIVVQERQGILEVRQVANRNALRIHIRFPRPEHLLQIITQARTMFDLGADPQVVHQCLSADRRLAPLLRLHPGLRLPGTWDRVEAVVYAVLRRRFPLHEVKTLTGLLVERCGKPLKPRREEDLCRIFPTMQRLATANLAFLPQSCARTIRAVARALVAVPLDAPPDELLGELTRAEGVDECTLDYVAMLALNDSDAFPAGDPELQRALGPEYDEQALLMRARAWKPWRAYATMYLLSLSSPAAMRLAARNSIGSNATAG